MLVEITQNGVLGGIYKIESLISTSPSGDMYAGTNTASDQKVEIQIARRDASGQLEEATSIYKALAGRPGIPFIHWSGTVGDRYAVVYDTLGPTLKDYLNTCHGRFSLKTVLLLAVQMITGIESMHKKPSKYYNIQPNTFRMGIGIRSYQVNLADFSFNRDPVFASINTHLGNQKTFHDDFKCLEYVFLYFLHGSLPWEGLKEDRMLQMKKETSIDTLCPEVPEIKTYVEYCRSLHFNKKSDYDSLRKLFRDAFDREGFKQDFVFDWVLYEKGPKNTQAIPQTTRHPKSAIICELEQQPISREQLVAESKCIYDKLERRELGCMKVDSGLHKGRIWQAHSFINAFWMHIHFLSGSHSFLLASQHPSASPDLCRLASNFKLPERVWEHGIHSFLELLRGRLPDSRDCMLSFTFLAYSTMTVFLEEFPRFENVWFECLGHISRYASHITSSSIWTGTAYSWYSKASEKSPTIGKFHCYLGIFAPNALQQLFHYSVSLYAEVPYLETRGCILALFNSIHDIKIGQPQSSLCPFDTAFLMAHRILFTGKETERFGLVVKEFLRLAQIDRVTINIAVINITAMLGYATKGSFLTSCITKDAVPKDEEKENTVAEDKEQQTFENARFLNNSTLEIILQRNREPNVLPFVHINLVFIYEMARHPLALHHLQTQFPWGKISTMLNTLQTKGTKCIEVPRPQKNSDCPLPEVIAMRPLGWAGNYLANELGESRIERILSLGHHFAKLGCGLSYNCSEHKFSALPTINSGKDIHEVSSSPLTIKSEKEVHEATTRKDILV